MRRALPLLAILALAGCSRSFDLEQARYCRIALPALLAPEAQIAIAATSGDPDGKGVVIRFGIAPDAARKTIHCRFEPKPDSPARVRLTAVETEAGPLPETQVYFLRRFWLETSEGWRADPEPVPDSFRAPEIARPAAYALQQALNALPLAAVYGLLAAAYSLVYGLAGRINLAFGEFAALGGYAALLGATLAAGAAPALALPAAILLAVFATTAHGVAAARLVFLPLAKSTGQQGLVATIGLALFLQEYLRLVQGADLRWISPLYETPFAVARAQDFVVTVTPMTLAVAGTAALAASGLMSLMKLSRFGREWRASADDASAAALFGVSPEAMLAKTFALACALAGLAGAMMTLYYGSLGYGASTALGLKALVAAILGGIGSVPGAFLGGLAIGAIEAGWSASFAIEYRDLVVYTLLAALLMFRPGGFLGIAAQGEGLFGRRP